MSREKIEKTATYQAIDDADTIHTISIYTTFIECKIVPGKGTWLPVQKSHKMRNGNHVNVHDDGTLEDVYTGKIMRCL
jgi:hypothetical protein